MLSSLSVNSYISLDRFKAPLDGTPSSSLLLRNALHTFTPIHPVLGVDLHLRLELLQNIEIVPIAISQDSSPPLVFNRILAYTVPAFRIVVPSMASALAAMTVAHLAQLR